MAEAKARISCATDCAAIVPTVDIVYDDIWTDEAAAGRLKDVSFGYLYADLTTPTAPTTRCVPDDLGAELPHPDQLRDAYPSAVGRAAPRAGRHYRRDLHAVPQPPGRDDAVAGARRAARTDRRPGRSTSRCISMSYRELLFNDNEQILDMGALQDRLVQVGVDPITGDPIFQTVNVAPSMSVGGALASPRFFNRFGIGGTHEGYLTNAELKLIAEWLDIGGQYFNNPFDAPPN